jgi:N-acyl-D-amino-acid deacylase
MTIETGLVDLDRVRIAWVPGRDHSEVHGQRLSAYVAASGLPAADAICDLLIEERLAVLCVIQDGGVPFFDVFLPHEKAMIGSDGIYFPDSVVHPRVYGTAGQVLGPCVRERKLFSLEEAVHKLSGFPAQRFGLLERGVIREKSYADLVVFDPESVQDRATFDKPHQLTEGISLVLVNGVPVFREGVAWKAGNGPPPGRPLRRGV